MSDGLDRSHVETGPYDCLNCGAGSEYTIAVWEDFEDWDMMRPPDYIGCVDCNEMHSVDAATEKTEADDE